MLKMSDNLEQAITARALRSAEARRGEGSGGGS
jgi:hypothetical protein